MSKNDLLFKVSEGKHKSLDGEVWRDVVGYEGLYLVSSKGRVFSLEKEPKVDSIGRMQRRRSTMLKLIVNTKDYHQVNLSKDGKRKEEKVHRLVAKAFLPNPNDLPFVNHKDEIKNNNHVGNLEWCTPEYNAKYKDVHLRASKSLRRKVVGVHLKDKSVIRFKSMAEAAKYGFSHSAISNCCRLKSAYHKGYEWFYEKDYEEREVYGGLYGIKV